MLVANLTSERCIKLSNREYPQKWRRFPSSCKRVCDSSRKEIGQVCEINRAGCLCKVDQLTLDCWELKGVWKEGKVPTSTNFASIPSVFTTSEGYNTWIVLIQVYALADVFWQGDLVTGNKGHRAKRGKWLSHCSKDLIEASICLGRLVTLDDLHRHAVTNI